MKNLNQVSVFSYVTCQKTPTYRAIMDCFTQAKDRYSSEIRPRDILQAFRSGEFLETEGLTEEDLEKDLDQLITWGNLSKRHDASEVSTIRDYYRPHWIYCATPTGDKAHRAITEVEATVGRHGSLKIQTLKNIQRVLAEVLDILKGHGQEDLLHQKIESLFTDFQVLEEESSHFMDSLHAFEKDPGEDAERFQLNKQAVFKYVNNFYEEVRAVHQPIEAMVLEIDGLGVRQMFDRASAYQELSPLMGKSSPKEEWIERVLPKWDGIRKWVISTEGAEARVSQLGQAARSVVNSLLRTLERLNDRISRKADRRADFLLLAEWFSACGNDDEAHDLARLAFGLHPSRHMHIPQTDVTENPPGTPWPEATPVELPESLRRRGKVNRQGRVSQIPDYSQAKLWNKEQRRRAREFEKKAIDHFISLGEFRAGDLKALSRFQFEFLLSLIGKTLSGRVEGTSRSATSIDGILGFRLTEPASDKLYPISTEEGVFYLRDFILSVERLSAGIMRERAAL